MNLNIFSIVFAGWIVAIAWLPTRATWAEPPDTATAKSQEFSESDEPLKVVVVGDIMLDNGPGHWISLGKDPFEPCASLIDHADLRVGNLECVLGRKGEMQIKPYIFRGASDSPRYLKRHFDALSLANNHSLDFGPEGLVGMLEVLEGAGIATFGAGRNRGLSRRPLVLERRGHRVALLGFNEFYADSYAAGAKRPGNNPLVAEDLLADIAICRNELHCDVILPFLHWGEEMETQPRVDQRELAQRCIHAGATAVLGAHPHVTQTIDAFQGRPIIYSLGNFVFDYYAGDPELCIGWVVELRIDRQTNVDWVIHSVKLDPAGIPSPVVTE